MSFNLIIYCLTFILALQDSAMSVSQGDECQVLFDGIDLKTKKLRKELAPQKLFEHTPVEIKNELLEKNLMTCQGQLMKIEDQTFLNLNVEVFSQIAQDHYGHIDPQFLLRIKLINGKEVDLKCRTGSIGEKSHAGHSFIYALSYPLDRQPLRSLARMEIDKIGIQWSTGYEEYTVYEVDFFITQIGCLNTITQKPN